MTTTAARVTGVQTAATVTVRHAVLTDTTKAAIHPTAPPADTTVEATSAATADTAAAIIAAVATARRIRAIATRSVLELESITGRFVPSWAGRPFSLWRASCKRCDHKKVTKVRGIHAGSLFLASFCGPNGPASLQRNEEIAHLVKMARNSRPLPQYNNTHCQLMNKLIFSSVGALALTLSSQVAHSAVVAVNDSFIAVANGTNPATAANTGAPTSGTAWNYTARERQNPGQTAIRVVTFLDFDVSTLAAADVADPNFSAIFTIDHVGHLNNLNTGFDLSAGVNVSGAWDSTTTLPQFAWAAASSNQTVLLPDVHLVPGAQGLSLDVTPLVQGWYTGAIPNQGVVLLGTNNGGNFSQASFLDNAIITTSIPEPSAMALVALGLFGLVGRRRRR